jgi:hypothetical protein
VSQRKALTVSSCSHLEVNYNLHGGTHNVAFTCALYPFTWTLAPYNVPTFLAQLLKPFLLPAETSTTRQLPHNCGGSQSLLPPLPGSIMKRKRSRLLVAEPPCKKATGSDSAKDASDKPCLFMQLLSQYSFLECIAAHIFPSDLFSLAATSKAAYNTIFPRKESRKSLLGKMTCDGHGIRVRQACHRKSQFFYEFECAEYAQCGADENTKQNMSHACISCGATTCNECRVHCVYQSIRQDPDEPDELPTYSGFILLDEHEMGILSPAHLGKSNDGLWLQPYHDQGFLDIPLESDAWATPENVQAILDYDLGSGPLDFGASSGATRPSPILGAFTDVTEERKRQCCLECYEQQRRQRKVSTKVCNCTLRQQFLDRWLCLKCYQNEEKATLEFPHGTHYTCSCGTPVRDDTAKVLCLWCWGEVKPARNLLLASDDDFEPARPFPT